ncbi:MAG: hypothetical protein KA711_07920 [Ideonella sp. WA131b]|jgi:hypothetical protein|nr:hypothetical protein [Ideonella sp. WA131b]
MKRASLLVAAVLAAQAAPAQTPAALAPAECPAVEPGAAVIDQPGLRATWRAEPAPAVSRPFKLQLTLCPARAELRRVDATMPEHRHGMNYRPRLQPAGPGAWTVDGLVWHMPGRWELLLVVVLDGQEQRLVQSMVLR